MFLSYRSVSLVFIVVFALSISASLSVIASDEVDVVEEREEHINEQSQSYSLKQALQLAYENNASLMSAGSELLSVYEGVPQALSGWKPKVQADASVSYTDRETSPKSINDGENTTKNVELSVIQPIYSGGSTVSSVDASKFRAMAQEQSLYIAEQQLMLSVASSYMDVVRNKAILELAVNNMDLIEKRLEGVKLGAEVGELTQTDISQAEARLEDAKAYYITSKANLRSSIASLEDLTGVKIETVNMPESNIDLGLPETAEKALSLALENHPQIIMARNLYDYAKETVKMELAGLLPDIDLTASLSRSYDPYPGTADYLTSGSVAVTASLPIYSAGMTRSGIRQAKYNARKAGFDLDEAVSNVRKNVMDAWEIMEATKSEKISRKAQVRASEIARDGVYSERDLGTRTVLDSLNADQELLDAKVALVTAQTNEMTATFRLAEAIGVLSPAQIGLQNIRTNDYKSYIENLRQGIFGIDVISND